MAVLLSGHPRDPDGPDDLPVHHERQPALDGDGALERQDARAARAAGQPVLEGLRGPSEGDCGPGLLPGHFHAAELRVVQPVKRHDVAPRIEHHDGDRPAVLLGLRFRAGQHLRRLLEGDRRTVGRWGLGQPPPRHAEHQRRGDCEHGRDDPHRCCLLPCGRRERSGRPRARPGHAAGPREALRLENLDTAPYGSRPDPGDQALARIAEPGKPVAAGRRPGWASPQPHRRPRDSP